jgi:hypothetical protein
VRGLGFAAALLVGASLVASSALAQDAATPAKPTEGFGKRSHGVFSIENALGFLEQNFSDNGHTESIDTKGFLAGLFGPRLAIHGIADSGLTYGLRFGFWHLEDLHGNGHPPTFVELSPRIGYAGAVQPVLGYWLRTGPSFFFFHEGTDDNTWFDWSFEAFGVLTPTDHFGVLIGPTVDIGINESHYVKYGTIGLAIGLLTDW